MNMSTFSGNIGPEEEDGAGWGGLVPTKAEREQERAWAELRHLRIQNQALLAALKAALPVITQHGSTELVLQCGKAIAEAS